MRTAKVIALMAFVLVSAATGAVAPPAPTPFPLMQSVAVDSDGTLHWSQRSFPIPALASPELRKRYVELLNQALTSKPADREAFVRRWKEAGQAAGSRAGGGMGGRTQSALRMYPSVDVEETEMGGVRVSVFTPKDIAPVNRKRVVMEFEMTTEAIALAALGKMKVVSVHFRTYPQGSRDVVAVYRTLLKSYKPSQIAMFGISGGCQLAATTAAWLPTQNLPFPAALGLLSCRGGSSPGDTRNTMNGFDPLLSEFTLHGASRSVRDAESPVKPGDPYRDLLHAPSIPNGFPPSYLLTGTRDMCLSQTALLHRKLRDAGIEADLNVFEGGWHGFQIEPDLPEAKSALTDFARFLDRHMAS